MKKLALILSFILITGSVVFAQGNQDFALFNETGVVIDQLYISPADEAEWQEDVLGVDVLQDGQQCNVRFSPAESKCEWDIKVVDTEGNEAIWENVDLCETLSITLRTDGGNNSADVVDEEGADDADDDAAADADDDSDSDDAAVDADDDDTADDEADDNGEEDDSADADDGEE